ncbi:MAG: hypothetical protein AMJ46_06285 [Latescibacteria bacterium DG_63]|nr:MAG: hypothetical protein AMJ46_06285 [Latescibacteria bacterium DG_63]
MRLFAFTCLLTIALGQLGCAIAPRQPAVYPIDGYYHGVFELQHLDDAKQRGPVLFRFAGGRYDVLGIKDHTPPRGCGSYTLSDVLILKDECVHQAHFDWSLILDGAYTYRYNGRTLILEQRDALGRYRRIVLYRVDTDGHDSGTQ